MPRKPADVTIDQEVTDRKAQREKLRLFFLANHTIIWSQETLADMCGADVGAVRTRISELKADGLNLMGHSGNYRDAAGIYHRAKKQWQYVPRPVNALGRDAGEHIVAPARQTDLPL